jgi:hypothetical protein
MQPDQCVVVNLPLAELWDSAGPLVAQRGRRLGGPEIRELLRAEGRVHLMYCRPCRRARL